MKHFSMVHFNLSVFSLFSNNTPIVFKSSLFFNGFGIYALIPIFNASLLLILGVASNIFMVSVSLLLLSKIFLGKPKSFVKQGPDVALATGQSPSPKCARAIVKPCLGTQTRVRFHYLCGASLTLRTAPLPWKHQSRQW